MFGSVYDYLLTLDEEASYVSQTVLVMRGANIPDRSSISGGDGGTLLGHYFL